MSVASGTAQAQLVVFGRRRRGTPLGLLGARATVTGDASGGSTDLSIEVPGSFAVMPICATVRALNTNAKLFGTIWCTALRFGSFLTYFVGPPEISADETMGDVQGTYNGFMVTFPRLVLPPALSESAMSCSAYLNDNINGRQNLFEFVGIAFDPDDVRQGFVDPQGNPVP